MLVCDKFIFLHLHKSGGTFVNQLMMTCLPGARKLGYHLPASEIPEEFRHLPVLGTVRNPLAYYVSWYHFQRQIPRPNHLFLVCSDGGRFDFAATVERLATLERRPALVDALVRVFPDQFVGAGHNLTKRCIAQIAGSGRGFYSFLYDRMYRGASNATILPAESLRSSLRAYLASHYPEPEPQKWRAFLNHAPDMNRSRHDAPELYYPDDLKRLIVELDRPVFDTYGYAMGTEASLQDR